MTQLKQLKYTPSISPIRPRYIRSLSPTRPQRQIKMLPVFSLTACTTAVQQRVELKADYRDNNRPMQQHNVMPEVVQLFCKRQWVLMSVAKSGGIDTTSNTAPGGTMKLVKRGSHVAPDELAASYTLSVALELFWGTNS